MFSFHFSTKNFEVISYEPWNTSVAEALNYKELHKRQIIWADYAIQLQYIWVTVKNIHHKN